MNISLILFMSLFSQHALGHTYVESNFFSQFSNLKKKANRLNKPILLIAGFEGCLGCDELKETVRQNERAFSDIAELFWMSTLAPGSYFFYSSLGISRIDSAPHTFLIKPHSNKAISMNRQLDIKTIQRLSQ